jgi:hypothetical protein
MLAKSASQELYRWFHEYVHDVHRMSGALQCFKQLWGQRLGALRHHRKIASTIVDTQHRFPRSIIACRTGDGFLNQCKECRNAQNRAYRQRTYSSAANAAELVRRTLPCGSYAREVG